MVRINSNTVQERIQDYEQHKYEIESIQSIWKTGDYTVAQLSVMFDFPVHYIAELLIDVKQGYEND